MPGICNDSCHERKCDAFHDRRVHARQDIDNDFGSRACISVQIELCTTEQLRDRMVIDHSVVTQHQIVQLRLGRRVHNYCEIIVGRVRRVLDIDLQMVDQHGCHPAAVVCDADRAAKSLGKCECARYGIRVGIAVTKEEDVMVVQQPVIECCLINVHVVLDAARVQKSNANAVFRTAQTRTRNAL